MFGKYFIKLQFKHWMLWVCVRVYRLRRWWLLPVKNTYRRSSSEKWQERLLLPLSICCVVVVVDAFFINNYSIFLEKQKCSTHKQHTHTRIRVNLNVVPFIPPCQSIDYVHRINGCFFFNRLVFAIPFEREKKKQTGGAATDCLTRWKFVGFSEIWCIQPIRDFTDNMPAGNINTLPYTREKFIDSTMGQCLGSIFGMHYQFYGAHLSKIIVYRFIFDWLVISMWGIHSPFLVPSPSFK